MPSAPVIGGNLAYLGALGGIGAGFERAMDKTREAALTIRDQNMRWKLGIGNLMLGIKNLEEERRQADLRNKQFYDGLKHEDILNIRGHKANIALRRLGYDYDLKLQKDQQEFTSKWNAANMVHDTEMTELREEAATKRARIQVAPDHRRVTLAERQFRDEQQKDHRGWAMDAVGSMLTPADGSAPSPENVLREAMRLYGTADSNVALERLSSDIAGRLASSKPNQFSELGDFSKESVLRMIESFVSNDPEIRSQAYMQMELDSLQAESRIGARQALDFSSFVEAGGSTYAPIRISRTTGRAEFYGDTGSKLVEFFKEADKSYGSNLEEWYPTFVAGLQAITGVPISEFDPEDLQAHEIVYEETTGHRIKLGGSSSAYTSAGYQIARRATGPTYNPAVRGTAEQQAAYPVIVDGLVGFHRTALADYQRVVASGNPAAIAELRPSLINQTIAVSDEAAEALGPELSQSEVVQAPINATLDIVEQLTAIQTGGERRQEEVSRRAEFETRPKERLELRREAKAIPEETTARKVAVIDSELADLRGAAAASIGKDKKEVEGRLAHARAVLVAIEQTAPPAALLRSEPDDPFISEYARWQDRLHDVKLEIEALEQLLRETE